MQNCKAQGKIICNQQKKPAFQTAPGIIGKEAMIKRQEPIGICDLSFGISVRTN